MNTHAHAHQGKPRAMSLVSTAGIGTTVTAHAVGTSTILLSYVTMPANKPSDYSNTAFIWQNAASIPYNQKPINSKPVPTNSQSGSMPFDGLKIQDYDYIIGYAVGSDITNICSWVYIPKKGGGDNQSFQTSVYVPPDGILPDVVLVQFDTPAGNMPQTNSQWIGIWQGSVPSYTATPMAQMTCNSNNSSDGIALPVTLLRNTTYTVGYMMGKKQTTLAAAFTFTT